MHIVIPLLNMSMSGGVRIALQYAAGLVRLRHKVTILVPENDEYSIFQIQQNIHIIKVVVPNSFGLHFGYLSIVYALARKLPTCDLVLASSWQTVFPAYFAVAKGHKVVHLIQHDDAVINSERSFVTRLRNSLLYRYIYQLPITKVVVSSWLQRVMREKYGQASLLVVNGVDASRFVGSSDEDRAAPGEVFNILCIGRTVEWKGFQDLVFALRLMVSKGVNVHLTVATQDPLRGPRDLPITIVRPKDDIALGSLYRSCNVFVCSSWQEGFGLPPLEAMGCGCPVVTTDCGGVNDFAIDGVNCLVVPPQCPTKLADAIIQLRDDNLLARRLAAGGIETAKRFTMDMTVNNMESVLKQILIASKNDGF